MTSRLQAFMSKVLKKVFHTALPAHIQTDESLKLLVCPLYFAVTVTVTVTTTVTGS
jgi:hypothetical protein